MTPDQQEAEDLGLYRLFTALKGLWPDYAKPGWQFNADPPVSTYGLGVDPPPGHMFVTVAPVHANARDILLTIPLIALRCCPVPMHPHNTIRPEDVEREIAREVYQLLPSGKGMVCELTLLNGSIECGISYTVDLANFDFEKGKAAARAKAVNEVYKVLAWRKHEYVTQKMGD